MDAHQEARIIARVQAGQTAEFAHLVHRYQAALFRIVANLLEYKEIEDVVQDIFLSAFAHIQRFDLRRGSFRAWLYKIARNRAFNALKKKRAVRLNDDQEIADPQTPADALLRKEIFRQLDQALAELNFQERVIFVLSEFEGLPYAEIARIEGLRLGTVKSRLARTRAKLRNILECYVN